MKTCLTPQKPPCHAKILIYGLRIQKEPPLTAREDLKNDYKTVCSCPIPLQRIEIDPLVTTIKWIEIDPPVTTQVTGYHLHHFL